MHREEHLWKLVPLLEFAPRREMRGQSFSPLQSSSAAVTGQRSCPWVVPIFSWNDQQPPGRTNSHD